MIKIFFKFVKNHLKASFFYFCLLILSNICIILQPLSLSHLLAKSQFNFDQDVLIFIGISILTPCIISYKDRTLNYVTNLMSTNVVNNMMEEVLHKDVLQIKSLSSNYIVRVINNFSWLISDFYLYTFLDAVISLISALMMFWILAQNNLYIALFILICHLLRLFSISLIQKKLTKSAEQRISKNNIFLSSFSNYMSKLKQIIIRSKEKTCYNILLQQSLMNLKATKTNVHWKSVLSSMGNTSFWIIKFATVLFGLLLSEKYGITFAILQLSFSYASEIGLCLQMTTELLPGHAQLKAHYNYMQSILAFENTKASGLKNNFNQVKLVDLNFGYKDKNVINHLNLEFNKGKIYVIKGENGKGKSTLMKVISGLYTGYKGQILLDNTPFENYNIEYYLTHLITFLTQEDLLFDGSIKDNLLANDQQAMQDIVSYLGITDLDKHITSSGENLSGGEKRKILLARTFLSIMENNPSLIIFDEPTYALEKETVQKVIEAIEQLANHCIVMVISHNNDFQKNNIDIHL